MNIAVCSDDSDNDGRYKWGFKVVINLKYLFLTLKSIALVTWQVSWSACNDIINLITIK